MVDLSYLCIVCLFFVVMDLDVNLATLCYSKFFFAYARRIVMICFVSVGFICVSVINYCLLLCMGFVLR